MIYTPILEFLMPEVIFRFPDQKNNRIYLTFDDGPDPVSTKTIVEILSKYEIKASFFVVGSQVEKNPDIIKLLDDKEHLICNHSYSHSASLFKLKTKLQDEIFNTQHLLNKTCTRIGNYYRPPYGRIYPGMKKAIKNFGYSMLLWDVFVPDYKPGYSSKKITSRIFHYARSGSIILLHDRSKNSHQTVKALPVIITTLMERGFKFSVLPSKTIKI